MRETAARERSLLFLAAVVAGEDDAPALATDAAALGKTASGGLIWSEPTTTWDVNDLGPESWWRAQYYYRWRWYAPAAGQFIGRDPLGHLDSPSLFQFVGHSPVNAADPFGQSGEFYYRQNSEGLDVTFRNVLRMDVETWLTGQDWDGLDQYKGNVKRRGSVDDFQQSGRYAYWIPGGRDFSIVKAMSSDWIARSWIRTMGAGSAQKGIGFVLGYPPLLIGEQVRQDDNISMQRARMAQLNVMVYFLDAVGLHAKRDAVGHAPRWMWSELKWGDDYVSQAARLGTRFVIERFNEFPMGEPWKRFTMNSLIQALVVNSRWHTGSYDRVKNVLNYVKANTGFAPEIVSDSQDGTKQIGGVGPRHFRRNRVRLRYGDSESSVFYYGEYTPGVKVFDEFE